MIAFGPESAAAAGACARDCGCLTVACEALDAEWAFVPPTDDPFVAQELAETLYHVLWELCHVFFDHRGLLEGRDARTVHDTGASSFLYPFLAETQTDLEAVVADVRAIGADEGGRGGRAARADAGGGRGDPARGRVGAAERVRRAAGSCSRSATAARPPTPWTRWPTFARRRGAGRRTPAIDLTEDSAIITAVANDVGVEAIFQRQVIAYGREGDALLVALHQRQLGQRHRSPSPRRAGAAS